MNKAIIYGNLGCDPEVKTVGEKKVAKFSLATSRRGKDKDGNKITDWHRVVLWDKLADLAGEYLKKGSSVIIEGEIQYGSYVNKDGVTIYTTDIVGNQMHFVGKKETSNPLPDKQGVYQGGAMSNVNDLPGVEDDLPF